MYLLAPRRLRARAPLGLPHRLERLALLGLVALGEQRVEQHLAVRAELAAMAREKFAGAREALKNLDWRVLRPALLMMGVYERYLDKMTARGWANGQPRVTLSKLEKTMIAARWLAAPKLTREAPTS